MGETMKINKMEMKNKDWCEIENNLLSEDNRDFLKAKNLLEKVYSEKIKVVGKSWLDLVIEKYRIHKIIAGCLDVEELAKTLSNLGEMEIYSVESYKSNGEYEFSGYVVVFRGW